MLDNLNELLDKISNYLIEKKYVKTNYGNDLYFKNHKASPSIVRIAVNEFDNDRSKFDSEISSLTKNDISPSIVEILLTYKPVTNATNVINIDSYKSANTELAKIFKGFKISKPEPEVEKFEGTQEEMVKSLQNPSKSPDEKLRKVINGFENPPFYTKLFAGLFVLVPIIVFVAAIFIFVSNQMFMTYGSAEVKNLFFGALDYKLTVVGNQWWRVLTYGLAPEYQMDALKTILQLIIFGWITFIMVKYAASMLGILKTMGTFLIAYLITGFALAFVAQSGSISGQLLPLSIITGIVSAVVVNPSKKTAGMFLTIFTKKRLVLPYFALLIYILFFSPNKGTSLLYIGMAFGTGFLVSIIFNHDYSVKNDTLWLVPLITILGIVAVMLVLTFISKYNPAINMNTVYALALQSKMGLMSIDKVNDLLMNNLGWEMKISIIGDLIARVI